MSRLAPHAEAAPPGISAVADPAKGPADHVLVLFGATGDLAGRKLLPGLFHLHSAGLLPNGFRVVGTAPSPALSDEGFRDRARERGLFKATPPVSAEVHRGIEKATSLIFEANQLAVEAGAPRQCCGVLVDEEFGAGVARQAKAEGVPLATPVERSGQDEFVLEYGDDFARHIDTFDPTFVKVLVRYNPEGDQALNRRQEERLARLSTWLDAPDRPFLFELLVPATTAQAEMFEDHKGDYDHQLRPELTVATLATLQTAGVEPDIWKVEGFDSPEDAAAVVRQARYRELISVYESASPDGGAS